MKFKTFMEAYNAKECEYDIIIFMYVATHPNCTADDIEKEFNLGENFSEYDGSISSLQMWIEEGYIKEDENGKCTIIED